MQNGDVLTQVSGSPASSQEAVVTAVLTARKYRQGAISGRFWRGDEEWAVVVELPYLAAELAAPVAVADTP
jgi:S1-C subfamily serine protease